jgi:hypothetical protein
MEKLFVEVQPFRAWLTRSGDISEKRTSQEIIALIL